MPEAPDRQDQVAAGPPAEDIYSFDDFLEVLRLIRAFRVLPGPLPPNDWLGLLGPDQAPRLLRVRDALHVIFPPNDGNGPDDPVPGPGAPGMDPDANHAGDD